MTDDRQLREMTCDPKFRKVLVTDAKTATGQALVAAVVAAGADLVWAGYAEPWKKPPGFERLTSIPQVSLLELDLTNSRAVHDIAGEGGSGAAPHRSEVQNRLPSGEGYAGLPACRLAGVG